jgi:uncharacterized protein
MAVVTPPDPRPPTRRLLSPRQVATVMLTGLLLALLLNARDMERSAETSPFGARRDVALALLGPASRVSQALGLDRPRAALDAALGHDQAPGNIGVEANLDAGPTVPLLPGSSLPPSSGRENPDPDTRVRPRPTPRPAWTPQDPLHLWVGGDSVAGFLSIEMVNLAQQTGVIQAHGHYKISTGLSRPDYYDWPEHLAADAAAYNPQVVIFCAGANDDQPLQTASGIADFGTGAWITEYSQRVGAMMDMLVAQHRLVVWVGLPLMRAADFNARMGIIDSIDQAQASLRPGVTFVDSRPIMADAQGQYSDYLPDASGQLTLMRAEDGIHLTPAGGTRLAAAVLDVVRRLWTTATVPVVGTPTAR